MPGDAETRQPRRPDRWSGITDIAADKNAGRDNPTSLSQALDTITGAKKETLGDGNNRDGQEREYYDISMLKPPVWTAEVGQYFFLGGLSAYAFVLARLAERFGGKKYSDVTRLGTAVAAVAALPCAPLLIWDLGDRKRFHHMLRVWKPTSPMNLGSWVLTSFTAVGGLVALRELARFRRGDSEPKGVVKTADSAVGVLGDVAGIPLAALLAGYTGVLLSTTATPIWAKNPWIGTLFSASAMSAGAGAVRLALEVKDRVTGSDENALASDALAKVETAARAVEVVAHAAYLATAGDLAAPLTTGRYRREYWGGAIGAGIVLPEIISRLPMPQKMKPCAKIVAGVIGLAGGYTLRLAFVAAGRPSASDPDAARRASRPKDSQPWEAPKDP